AYAIKGHYSYLSRTDREVVVSYVVRSYNEDETLSNPTLYCPYFVKLVFQTLPGDMNDDGVVNILDILYVAVHFGEETSDPGYDPNADVDGNGVINILDILVIAVHFGETW
ncbi:MAG: dockerin type I domain-containing protein, partial [Candidatus Bathyarchaeia archaeon]